MPMVRCTGCKQEREHCAKRLCRPCYRRAPKAKVRCTSCGQEREHCARGLCRPCYSRQRLATDPAHCERIRAAKRRSRLRESLRNASYAQRANYAELVAADRLRAVRSDLQAAARSRGELLGAEYAGLVEVERLSAEDLVVRSVVTGTATFLSTAPDDLLDALEALAHEVYDENADGSVLEFVGSRGFQAWRVIVGASTPAHHAQQGM